MPACDLDTARSGSPRSRPTYSAAWKGAQPCFSATLAPGELDLAQSAGLHQVLKPLPGRSQAFAGITELYVCVCVCLLGREGGGVKCADMDYKNVFSQAMHCMTGLVHLYWHSLALCCAGTTTCNR